MTHGCVRARGERFPTQRAISLVNILHGDSFMRNYTWSCKFSSEETRSMCHPGFSILSAPSYKLHDFPIVICFYRRWYNIFIQSHLCIPMLLPLSLAIRLSSIIAIFDNQILRPIVKSAGKVRIQDILCPFGVAFLRIQ